MQRAIVVIVVFVSYLVVVSGPSDALTQPTAGILGVTCTDVERGSGLGALIRLDISQSRINEGGLEYFQAAPFYKDLVTGQFYQDSWTPFGDRMEGGDQGFWRPFFYNLAPSNYYVGSYFKWWYWTGSRWDSVTRYAWASNALGGPYHHEFGTDIGGPATPDTSCKTDSAYFRVNVTLRGFNTGTSSTGIHPRENPQLQAVETLRKVGRRGVEPSPPATQAERQRAESCLGRKPTIVGSDDADGLVGTPRADVIVGMGGDDVIVGGGGADRICGGDGTDIVEGGAGADHLSGGGQALDIIAYLFSGVGVELDFKTGRASNERGVDRFEGFNAVVGSDHDDTLMGSPGEQWFVPLGGDDRVNGGGDQDVIVYLLSSQGVEVELLNGRATGEGSDSLAGLEVVFGSPFDDDITGAAGYDLLYGDDGDDAINGIGGGDTLDAGNGMDVCTNGDVFVDCENQSDSLVLPAPAEPPTTGEPADIPT